MSYPSFSETSPAFSWTGSDVHLVCSAQPLPLSTRVFRMLGSCSQRCSAWHSWTPSNLPTTQATHVSRLFYVSQHLGPFSKDVQGTDRGWTAASVWLGDPIVFFRAEEGKRRVHLLLLMQQKLRWKNTLDERPKPLSYAVGEKLSTYSSGNS